MAAGCVVRVRPADSTAFEKIFASGPIQKSRTFPNHLDTYTATPGPAQLPFMHRRTGKKGPEAVPWPIRDAREGSRRGGGFPGAASSRPWRCRTRFSPCSIYQDIDMIVVRCEFVWGKFIYFRFLFCWFCGTCLIWWFQMPLELWLAMCLFRNIWTKVYIIRPMICHPITVLMPYPWGSNIIRVGDWLITFRWLFEVEDVLDF